MRWITRALLGGPALLLAAGTAHAADCAALARLTLPATTITAAEEVPAGSFKPPGPGGNGPGANFASLPAFCRVAGTLRPTADSDIRFEVWMPVSGWNGKFAGVGNGVWAGSISYGEMASPLQRGYATAATDDGHQGNPLDASFAAGHPEKLVDFGHRAVHEMTRTAKAVIQAFYTRPPQRSLFVSCSTGGRQGLMEAYRYPEDYDGISSMAPANPMTRLMVSSLWTGHATMKDAASRIPAPKFARVHAAAVAACDADDGVKDGIIAAPRRCRFDPAVLACKSGDSPDCLTPPQVEAVRAIYQGPRNPRTGEQIHPGFEIGSEQMFPLQASGPEPFGAALSYLRALVFKDPQWDFNRFDYDGDLAKAVAIGADALDVPATGLDRFFVGNRKLLLSHGLADGLIPAQATVDFHQQLAKHIGGARAQRNLRLFLAPGVNHCAGGDGPSVIDHLGTLDRWVETNQAPERIVASNPPGAPARTRPLCAYPQQAVYSGQGSTDEERNFRCAAGSAPGAAAGAR